MTKRKRRPHRAMRKYAITVEEYDDDMWDTLAGDLSHIVVVGSWRGELKYEMLLSDHAATRGNWDAVDRCHYPHNPLLHLCVGAESPERLRRIAYALAQVADRDFVARRRIISVVISNGDALIYKLLLEDGGGAGVPRDVDPTRFHTTEDWSQCDADIRAVYSNYIESRSNP